MRNCEMRKVQCGMDGAEICCGMACKVRNASLACILAAQGSSAVVRELQFTVYSIGLFCILMHIVRKILNTNVNLKQMCINDNITVLYNLHYK